VPQPEVCRTSRHEPSLRKTPQARDSQAHVKLHIIIWISPDLTCDYSAYHWYSCLYT